MAAFNCELEAKLGCLRAQPFSLVCQAGVNLNAEHFCDPQDPFHRVQNRGTNVFLFCFSHLCFEKDWESPEAVRDARSQGVQGRPSRFLR